MLSLDGAQLEHWRIEQMNAVLGHRGPDGRGIFIGEGVALGHRRLSVVDLAGGAQPMADAAETVWITFNGEIFNYIELRDDLRARGHVFQTESDTEVILHLYKEYGDDFVSRMNGEWALALWDCRRRRLLLSRDRAGVRPLFYALANRRLTFASEIKSLFQDATLERAIDVEALDQIFTFWAPLAPRTAFKGVYEVAPGHSVVVSDGQLQHVRYWRLEDFVQEEHDPTDDVASAGERLLELLVDATRLRLRADVPVSAFVSGGLDSTIVAAIAARQTPGRLHTFSLGFDDPALDERHYQSQVVSHLRAEHSGVCCTASAIADVFPTVVWHTETPILRAAPAAMFLLSRHVRERGFTVVLTGEGADETLGGYDIYKEAKIRRFCSKMPNSAMRPLLLRRLYPYQPLVQRQSPEYLRSFFRATAEDCASPFFSHLPRWALTSGLKQFYSDGVRAQLAGVDPIRELGTRLPARFAHWDDLARAQHFETTGLLPGYILSSQGDRMSMAHGIEGRFPFLDHRVMEFAAGLPSRFKMKALNEKYVLKRATSHLVPDSIVRRHKQPFRAPDARCFFPAAAGNRRPEYVDELLSAERLAQDAVFDAAAVQRLVTKARTGRELGVRDNMSIVGILSTQILIDRFIRNTPDVRH